MYLSLMGRHDEAIAQIKRARELDPLSSLINLNIGTILYSARRYDEAIEAFRKTLELDRDNAFAHFQLGAVHAAQANYAAALAAYQEAIKLGEGTPRTQIYLGAAYAMAGQREQARAILKRLETGTVYVSPAQLAILQAALGERERAFASLEVSFANHDVQLQYLKANPAYDGLRDDPRFQDILRRVGLAQ
jgi:tetratricopeptide (TPR) repeat protein